MESPEELINTWLPQVHSLWLGTQEAQSPGPFCRPDFAQLLGQPEAARAGDPALPYCLETTGTVYLQAECSKNIHALPSSPPFACPSPPRLLTRETPEAAPTYSVPCGLVGFDQATTGDAAGDSILSSSASSSWEGSLFLQEHRHGKGLQGGRSHRQGANLEPCRSPRANPGWEVGAEDGAARGSSLACRETKREKRGHSPPLDLSLCMRSAASRKSNSTDSASGKPNSAPQPCFFPTCDLGKLT